MVGVLQYSDIVSVCFSCGAEKTRVFESCSSCGVQPCQHDEIFDSLVLSRYASADPLLSEAVAARSPGVVLKTANRSAIRAVKNALNDSQLCLLLGLATAQKTPDKPLNRTGPLVKDRVQSVEARPSEVRSSGLEACLQQRGKLSVWERNEKTLIVLNSEAGTASPYILLEAIADIAERCQSISEQELQSRLIQEEDAESEVRGLERYKTPQAYEKNVVGRIVEALEKVHTEDLIDLFSQMRMSIESRRDKRALPVVKALQEVYKSHALKTLRLEKNNINYLVSAIMNTALNEYSSKAIMMGVLESLVANWRKVAEPLGGVTADREASGIKREVQGDMQRVASYLADKCQEEELSARAYRLHSELM